jgi:GMP synthase (glutamine-hydrolysing)
VSRNRQHTARPHIPATPVDRTYASGARSFSSTSQSRYILATIPEAKRNPGFQSDEREQQMNILEIPAGKLNTRKFIREKVKEISETVGEGSAITALSGGVDSSVVTVLGHKALGEKLKTYFIDNGLMRKDEPQSVARAFRKLGIQVEIIDAKKAFFGALRGLRDPEKKREAITQTFYKKVFGPLFKKSGATYLLQGTILTDVEETVAGVKRQHNVLEQLGIDPQKAFGYSVVEPLVQLRKDGVRKLGKALGLPETIYNRMPFPGPALAARVVGEASRERIEFARKATAIVETELKKISKFQCMAILHEDRFPGMLDGKREFGLQVEVRCWKSVDARTATPIWLSPSVQQRLARRITKELPGVVSVTYNITPKPPSTMEAV